MIDYTEEYKGFTIEIKYDEDAESPSTWEDSDIFLVADHRNFHVKPPKDSTFESVVADYKKTHHVLGLEAYIHSGVRLALSREGKFPDRTWDVSQLGVVLVSKAQWKTKEKARAAALSLIEEWNQYLSGDVWGYVVKDNETGEKESCWGFYGLDYCKEEAKSVASHMAKRKLAAHIARKKVEITKHVPLEKRSSLNNKA